MVEITINEAFGNAPPRRPAVLCLQGPDGNTDLIKTEWFTWLNTKHQPMISFSMNRNASLGMNLKKGDPLVLAFPPVSEALLYRNGIRTATAGKEKQYPAGVEPVRTEGLDVKIPKGSEVALACVLAGAYNYPFKKVRIFNCNLEKTLGSQENPDFIPLD